MLQCSAPAGYLRGRSDLARNAPLTQFEELPLLHEALNALTEINLGRHARFLRIDRYK